MTDLEDKKLTVVIPMDTYLKAVAKMTPLRLKFQGLLLGLLQEWVDGRKNLDAAGVKSGQVSDSMSKDLPAVEQFRAFLKSAPKEDVHMVLSLMARFTANVKEDSERSSERRTKSR